MTKVAHANTDDFFSDVIDPIKEMGAYEAMWAQEKNFSFKKVAEKLTGTIEDYLPSNYISNEVAFDYAEMVLNKLKSKGINDFGLRINGTFDYSEKLRDATHPVQLLYFRGDWDYTRAEKSVAVVGSREVSQDGLKRTNRLVKELVKEGYTIFSGLAKGVDTAAHKTAIENNGKTVAIIGTPICDYYPKENKELQDYIASNYCLISQVPIIKYSSQDWRYNRVFFPERNKTMSALSDATIIVEAGETSGTLTQARAAIAQNRKLFILNNCFNNNNISWPEKYEKKGAIRVRSIDDILKNLESDS